MAAFVTESKVYDVKQQPLKRIMEFKRVIQGKKY